MQSFLGVLNENMSRLENNLLKLQALQDVNVTGLSDGDILKYDGGTAKFINVGYGYLTTTTTTTSSTTTTTTA
jgi:hypothetical protein